MHPELHLQQWLFCEFKALESNASNYRVPPVPSGSSKTPNKLRLRLLLGESSPLPFLLPPCLPNQPVPLHPVRISLVHFQRSRGHISGQLLCPPKHDRPQLFIRFTNYKLSDTVRGSSFAHNNPVCALVRKPEARAICHSPAPSLVKVAILSPPWSSSATSLSVMMAACQ